MAQHPIDTKDEYYVLAGDVGGTNTTIALVQLKSGIFTLLEKRAFASRSISGVEFAVDESLKDFGKIMSGMKLAGCCIAAAGPVIDNVCQLTNVSWTIDGNALSRHLGLPVFIINDLSGVSYGIPLLDPEDPKQVVKLKHPDGHFPPPQELHKGTEIRAVVAPGTGLGIGYLLKTGGNYVALPAEAGHIDWAPFNDETRELQKWTHEKYGSIPGVEQFVSGLGLENVLNFMLAARSAPKTSAIQEILAQPEGTRGGLIAKHSEKDETCAKIMDLFVDMLARFVSGVGLWMLPKAGLFLAGGIPAKNLSRITANDRFMKLFLKNYQSGIQEVLHHIPVYVALDYSINLYGAAHGFHCLSRAK